MMEKAIYWKKMKDNIRKSIYAFPVSGSRYSVIIEKAIRRGDVNKAQFYIPSKDVKRVVSGLKKVI